MKGRFYGENRNNLLIRYGGFRYPMTKELVDQQRAKLPCMPVEMDGSGVFNFVQKEVPPAIRDISSRAGVEIEDIDYFLFHQPNRFMLEKLAQTLGVPYEKMPMNITEKYGNSGSGTIPMTMSCNAYDALLCKENLCCLSGFGGGLSWASMVMKVGPLDFCENIESNL